MSNNNINDVSNELQHQISQEDHPCSQKAYGEGVDDDEEAQCGDESEAISCSVLCSLGAKATAAAAEHHHRRHHHHSFQRMMEEEDEEDDEEEDRCGMTPAVAAAFCSGPTALCNGNGGEEDDPPCSMAGNNNNKARKLPLSAASMNQFCPKQLQLPMFLSKTFHMIDKCDGEIATWSDSGDNFVVKNVEKFASIVLPLYFKHSNFSSFARQLNFYGFRKLRSEAILTAEIDPCSACFVRFYHENFHRDKPDLLTQIKRATKGDQQSKDDVDSLRIKIYDLKDALRSTVCDYDRKLSELSHEWNHRFSVMKADQEKLVALVQRALDPSVATAANNSAPTAFYANKKVAKQIPAASSAVAASAPILSGVHDAKPAKAAVTDLLHSLSQAAVSLDVENDRGKRPASETSEQTGNNKKNTASRAKRS